MISFPKDVENSFQRSKPHIRNTPLEHSPYLSKMINGNVYLKLEGCNPTGSFKDRGMVVAISGALKDNKEHIICASTGNTSASASAYGARYGLDER